MRLVQGNAGTEWRFRDVTHQTRLPGGRGVVLVAVAQRRRSNGMAMKPVSETVRTLILNYASANGGRIYAPVDHPEFAALPHLQGPERFELIRPFLDCPGGTVLDVGSHWGY